MLPSPSACKAEEEKERDDNPAAKLAQAPNNSFLNELRGHFPFNFPSTLTLQFWFVSHCGSIVFQAFTGYFMQNWSVVEL